MAAAGTGISILGIPRFLVAPLLAAAFAHFAGAFTTHGRGHEPDARHAGSSPSVDSGTMTIAAGYPRIALLAGLCLHAAIGPLEPPAAKRAVRGNSMPARSIPLRVRAGVSPP